MEEKATRPHDQVSQERDQKDLFVALTPTIKNAFDAQPHKQKVRQRVDDFGRVDSSIIVLE
jgi:hypothetical protein